MVLSDEERKRRHGEANKKWQKENPEKNRESSRKWNKDNREKANKNWRKWREENLEKERKRNREWQKDNPELSKTYQQNWREKNPRANTTEMTKYRNSHRECEWSYCEQIKLLHVHHILSQRKHPEHVDGNYHGRLGNNFICYCPFHHFAYHYTYSITRNDRKHQHALQMLWFRVEQWANNNKISIEDLEIELAQMLPVKVILA